MRGPAQTLSRSQSSQFAFEGFGESFHPDMVQWQVGGQEEEAFEIHNLPSSELPVTRSPLLLRQ